MYAYLEGQRYLDGYLGFRLGRQYVVDSLGFWSFDGAEVMLTTPAYLAFELYAGFEQRGGLPMMSSSRFEAGGCIAWRSFGPRLRSITEFFAGIQAGSRVRLRA